MDLQGRTMLYGGDTDIAYTGCRMGFGKGVFSRLHLTHLIPAARCTSSHLCRVARGKGYSEVLHGYVISGVVPPPDTLSLAVALRQSGWCCSRNYKGRSRLPTSAGADKHFVTWLWLKAANDATACLFLLP